MINKYNNKQKWSQGVTKKSNALDLEEGVFTFKPPKKVAMSLRRSALESKRRKGTPFQSAMSMLNFYINRAGKNLNLKQKKNLNQAKIELRLLFKKQNNEIKKYTPLEFVAYFIE